METLGQVLRELSELKAMVLQLKPAQPATKLDMSRAEVMAELGFEPDEVVQFYQLAYRLKLKPYRRKHYRREDVVEAVAKAAFLKMKPVRKAAKTSGIPKP